jgi:hypothetical protein
MTIATSVIPPRHKSPKMFIPKDVPSAAALLPDSRRLNSEPRYSRIGPYL